MPDLEYPAQTYRPSWKLRLVVRFDEFGQNSKLQAKVPPKTTKNLNGVKDDRGNLQVVQDPSAPQGVTRFLLQAGGGSSAQPAQAQSTSSDGLTQVLGGIIPKEFDWKQNGIRTADTLRVVLKFVDLPVDPRTTRSIAVEFYLGCLDEKQWEQVHGDGASSNAQGADEPLNVVPDGWTDAKGKQRSNLRFQGWVDSWENDWSEDGEPTVTLECRDNTQLLIDQQQPPRLVLSAKDPIDKAIATYLSHFPQFQGLTVEYRPAGDTPPTLGDALHAGAQRPKMGPQPAHGAGAGAQGEKCSAWDYLTDVCGMVGHTVRMEGTTVVVQRVRSLYGGQAQGRPDDPFSGRTLPSGVQFSFRRFIWGRNVLKMRTKRTFARRTPHNVEVRCWNPEQKQVLVARFPLPADRIAFAIPGDAQPDQKWVVYRVSGLKDMKALRAIAQGIYESVGRNELTVEIQTRNLASFGGGNEDPDILDAKPGDTLEVLVARDLDYSDLTRVEQMLVAQQTDLLKKIGYSGPFADAYAKAYADAGFQTTYRLRTLAVRGHVEEGIDFKIEAVNYIEVRANKELAPGEEPSDAAAPAPKPQLQAAQQGPPPDLPPIA